MRKTGGFWCQIGIALPRIIMATILGIVISKPLELKIFEKEIDKQLHVIINRNKAKLQAEIKQRHDIQGKFYHSERDSLFAQQKRLKAELNQATLDLEKEIVGTSTETTTGKIGYGSNAKRKEELKKLKQQDYDNFNIQNKARLDSLDSQIKSENTEFETELANTNPVEDRYNGFAARMQALSELGAEFKILGVASLFITLLFILLEVSPVLVKLIMPRGPYDYLLELHEFQFQSRNSEDIQIKDAVSRAKVEMFTDEVDHLVEKNKTKSR